MAGIIDLFSSKIDEEKLVGNNNFFDKQDELLESNKLQNKFISNVDYSNPSNFARFGSAEEYYKAAISYIDSEYVYDGSKTDKLKWKNSLNELEYYIFNNEYPKSVGHVSLSGSQYIEVFSHVQSPGSELRTVYENGTKYTSNTQLDFSKGVTFESWLKFYDNSESSSLLSITAQDIVDNQIVDIELFSIIRDTDGLLKIKNGSNVYPFNALIAENVWNHYSINITSNSAKLFINGLLTEELTNLNIAALSNEYIFVPLGLMLVPLLSETMLENFDKRSIFKIGGGEKFSADEVRLWNESRTVEEIGRYWFTTVNGNDFLSETNSSLLFYYKFNEGWDEEYKFMCLDSSGRKNDSEILNYSTDCRANTSAIDDSGLCDDAEKPDVIYRGVTYSSAVKEFYETKIASAKEYDEQNTHLLYNKFPSWLLEDEESNNPKHLKQLIQIISVYFDDLYNKVGEITEYKSIKYDNSTDNVYPFYDKILTSMGFDVTDLFSNLSPIERYSSRSEITLFDEDIEKTKNKILKNIYNNLNYILKTKGTDRSLKSLLKSYGVNEELVRINLYSDGAEYNAAERLKEVVVKKKVIPLSNDSSIYLSSSAIPNETYNYTLESSIIFNSLNKVNSLITGSIMGLNVFANNSLDSQILEKYNIFTEKDDILGHKLTLIVSGTTQLSSSTEYIDNLYDNTVWNICLRKKINVDDINTFNFSEQTPTYSMELYAVNKNRHFVKELSCSVPSINDPQGSIRYYIGAEKENLTGSVINQTNFDILYCNFWNDYLNNSTVISHNLDISNYGVN